MVFEFIQKWYIDPIIYDTGYNIVNTATYAIILITAASPVNDSVSNEVTVPAVFSTHYLREFRPFHVRLLKI